MSEEQAHAALTRIPRLADRAAQARLTRLGGLTNLVFKVELGSESYCLRIPGAGTEAYINRRDEAVNARAAAAAGVSPEILFFEDGTGLMLSRFIDGAVTMSPDRFRDDPGAVARAGRSFRRLHDSGQRFANRIELFDMIDEYLGVLARLGASLPEGYHDVVAEAASVREALALSPAPLVACHCDPLCENFLDAGERLWIVDWEYSGMNDPMWDLGDLSVEGKFGAAQDEEMFRAYFGGEPRPSERGRIVIYKAMCDLLWTLWGLIQLANKNPADDFWAYSTNRFERCKALIRSPVFGTSVSAVRAGGCGRQAVGGAACLA
jgi:thiamine kinase-like enzyme